MGSANGMPGSTELTIGRMAGVPAYDASLIGTGTGMRMSGGRNGTRGGRGMTLRVGKSDSCSRGVERVRDLAQVVYPGVAKHRVVRSTVVAVGSEHGRVPRHVHFEQAVFAVLDLRLGSLHVIGLPRTCLCELRAGGHQIRHQRLILLRLCWRTRKAHTVLEVRLEGISRLPRVRLAGGGGIDLGILEEPLQEGSGVLPSPAGVADLLG